MFQYNDEMWLGTDGNLFVLSSKVRTERRDNEWCTTSTVRIVDDTRLLFLLDILFSNFSNSILVCFHSYNGNRRASVLPRGLPIGASSMRLSALESTFGRVLMTLRS